jgi:TetR/AcrR family transcriptional repressor for divergent bdcA
VTATQTLGSRGRPRSFDMDEAIHRAMRLFHRHGYDAVGVAELGAELGIKPPSFYAAFGSKVGLFERALERYAAGDANVFGRAQAEGGSVAEVIERTFDNAARFYPEHDGAAGCLVLDGARNSGDPEARAVIAAIKENSRATIRDYIAGKYPAQADELADLVVIALSGMSAAARDGAGATTLEAFSRMMARTFRREARRSAGR